MEKITTKSELIERLKDVLALEKIARDGYEEDTMTFKNFELKEAMDKIKIDEIKHIKILEGLIDMLEGK